MPADLDHITLEDITLDVIVGILDIERVEPQPLVMDLALYLDLGRCGATGELSHGVDYAVVLDQVRAVAEEGRWWLIESLALAVCGLLLAEPVDPGAQAIQRVDLRIRKPAVLGGVAVPGVSMSRRSGALSLERMRLAPGVTGEKLVQPKHGGAWRICIEPGASFALPSDCAALILAGEFEASGVGDRIPRGGAVLVSKGARAGWALVLGRLAV